MSHLEIALAGCGVTGHEPYLRISATVDCNGIARRVVTTLIAFSRR
jgi:hypothetical protein